MINEIIKIYFEHFLKLNFVLFFFPSPQVPYLRRTPCAMTRCSSSPCLTSASATTSCRARRSLTPSNLSSPTTRSRRCRKVGCYSVIGCRCPCSVIPGRFPVIWVRRPHKYCSLLFCHDALGLICFSSSLFPRSFLLLALACLIPSGEARGQY